MRGTAWFVVLLLLAAGAYAWWRYAPETLPAGIPRPAPRAPENPALFKWRDAQGQWHITDMPPDAGPYERVVVDPDTNVVPSTPLPGDPPADGADGASTPR